METNVDKSKMLDAMNRPLTQSLFLEIGYGTEAQFTLKEEDHEYNGKTYPSIKRLYLECADPTEYEFATTYLLGWKHWVRLCANKVILRYIEEWRVELEVKLRSRGVLRTMAAADAGNYQAAKWLADRGWDNKGAGRPTKGDIEHERKIQAAIGDEYAQDEARMRIVK